MIRAASKGKLNGKITERSASGINIEISISEGSIKTAYPVLR